MPASGPAAAMTAVLGHRVTTRCADRASLRAVAPPSWPIGGASVTELTGLSLIAAFGSAPLDELARSALERARPGAERRLSADWPSRQFEAQAVPLSVGWAAAVAP